MELTTASIAGPLRLVLQVVSARRQPQVEIYFQVRNVIGPAVEMMFPDAEGRHTQRTVTRDQDAFVQFDLVNIGGERAENVALELVGDFTCRGGKSSLSDKGIFRGSEIPQLAPAQLFPLFRFDGRDLFVDGPDGRPGEPKPEGFSVVLRYNGPAKGANRLLRWIATVRGKKQFETTFSFAPGNFSRLDLPPKEYA